MMGYRTPNIDRIAKEGALFTDSYAGQTCTAIIDLFRCVRKLWVKPVKPCSNLDVYQILVYPAGVNFRPCNILQYVVTLGFTN